ncbi:acetolactate synthase [Cantharellus anzutake]|uniref:acetolactate synthase n=1 Tax=Cantharellus anzutake TaxID=1750568 RepID=UPI0019056A16|nr:acetolactate synthase [Cantharellus anzutake]KAF8335770.1 acetolactate synthase [Cantharellus anzutake]
MSVLQRHLRLPCARIQHISALKMRWSSSSRSTQSGPPRTADDSTSALTYKQKHLSRPPPLPATDLPRARSAEEAVTNILYNTPPPSSQPFKKHILNCLVQNEPGVLSRISGTLAGRGFNIDSLVVCRTEIRDLSRMTIVLTGQDGVVEQARRQLEDLVPVWAVLNYTNTRLIERELLLAKVSILGPEYLADQLVGGPSHEPSRNAEGFMHDRESEVAAEKLRSEMVLAETFQHSGQQQPQPASAEARTLTPSEALRIKHQHLSHIRNLADQFDAKVVDISENSVIVEMSGKTSRVEAFLSLLKPFGLIESARTGVMVMPRTPLPRSLEDEDPTSISDAVDASLLPPG